MLFQHMVLQFYFSRSPVTDLHFPCRKYPWNPLNNIFTKCQRRFGITSLKYFKSDLYPSPSSFSFHFAHTRHRILHRPLPTIPLVRCTWRRRRKNADTDYRRLCGHVPCLIYKTNPEVSRNLRFSDFMTTEQDGGTFVSLTHRPLLPPWNSPGNHFC
jgi:hypothetical protein